MLRQATSAKRDAQVSICVPCKDQLHSAFAFDLTKLVQHCTLTGLQVLPQFCIGTLIVNQREQLVDMAKQADSTHILWLDSDMMFHPTLLHELLAHDLPIVAGNYVTRQHPHKTVAYTNIGDWRSYVMHDASAPDLCEVQAIGMGCMLVKSEVMRRMEKPLFSTTWIPETNDHMGEDYYFCQRARQLGYPIMVDNSVSLRLSHLGTFAFTHDLVRPGLQ